MSKPGKVLKGLCKKLGVRLTVKRGKKRVYKSVAVLKRQCANKKKAKKKKVVKRRRRRFGMYAPPPIHLQKALEEQKVQEELYSNIENKLGGGQVKGIGRKISEHYTSIYETEQRKRNIKKVIEAAKSWPNVYDFIEVDLKGMDISDYDMREGFIKFNDINFEGSNLEGADLRGHIFVGTGFMNANLKNAKLGAEFKSAFLEGANLEGADLKMANFDKTDLRRANLKNIEVNELTSFNRADLRNADLRGVDLRIIPILFDEHKPNFTGAIYNDRPVTINGINYGRTYLPEPYIPEQEGMVLNNSNSFGKRRKTKKVKEKRKKKSKNNFLGILLMSKPGKVLRNLCKKLGIRLTVKRGKKRVYKSVAVLKRQCANKKRRKLKEKRRFGTSGTGDVNTENVTFVYNEGTYIGQIKNGKKHGHGKMTYNNDDVYDGDWKDNKKHGQGVMKYGEESTRTMSPYGYGEIVDRNAVHLKSVYGGSWKEDKRHGTGTQTFMDQDNDEYIYKGEWKNNKRHGKGKYTIDWFNYRYDGQWEDGNPNGSGIESRKNYTYVGQWKDGMKHGKGKIEHNNDEIYDGDWKDGMKHGEGKSVEFFGKGEDKYGDPVRKHLIYEGEWKDDEKHGKGVGEYVGYGFDWIKYKGNWKHDNEEGKGIMSWSTGRIYTGDFKKGKKYGYGVETKFGGEGLNLLYKGYWIKDDLIDGDYHLYQDGVYSYTKYDSKDSPDGSVITVKTEDTTRAREGLKEFNKVRANFLREGFGKRRKKRKRKK